MEFELKNKGNIKFECLIVEITRKCQLRCRHCMKGDAENLDMSVDIMEKVLDQTDTIEKLVFTGGEPFLNFNGIIQFMTKLVERNIDLHYLEIETNGVIYSPYIVLFIKRTCDYIAMCMKGKNLKSEYVRFVVNEDIYHKEQFDASRSYVLYKDAFKDNPHIVCSSSHRSNVAFKYGRALDLEDAFEIEKKPCLKCEIMTKDKRPAYPVGHRTLDNDNQVYLLSSLYLTAKGNLLDSLSMRKEFVASDISNSSMVCTYNHLDNIIENVIAYNEGKMHFLPWLIGNYARKQSNDYIADMREKNKSEYSQRKMDLLNSVMDEIEDDSKRVHEKTDIKELLKQWIEYKQCYNEDEYGRYKEYENPF